MSGEELDQGVAGLGDAGAGPVGRGAAGVGPRAGHDLPREATQSGCIELGDGVLPQPVLEPVSGVRLAVRIVGGCGGGNGFLIGLGERRFTEPSRGWSRSMVLVERVQAGRDRFPPVRPGSKAIAAGS